MAERLTDPSEVLPRDMTGRYLHLKLKRFGSIKELSMAFAIKTWKEIPQDAEVDISPSRRSKCRECHETIEKGELRMRLWLQCEKGCKNSAYFHGSKECFWDYPETTKLQQVEEIKGMENIPPDQQKEVHERFEEMKGKPHESKRERPVEEHSLTKKVKRGRKK